MKGARNHRRRRINNTALKSQEDVVLLESAKVASSKAIRSSKAMGITIQIIKGRKVLEVKPDNTTIVIKSIAKSRIDTHSLKKGMVLTRK